jgi:hypothetical protein
MGCEQPNTRALITPEIARHLVRIPRRLIFFKMRWFG